MIYDTLLYFADCHIKHRRSGRAKSCPKLLRSSSFWVKAPRNWLCFTLSLLRSAVKKALVFRGRRASITTDDPGLTRDPRHKKVERVRERPEVLLLLGPRKHTFLSRSLCLNYESLEHFHRGYSPGKEILWILQADYFGNPRTSRGETIDE